ncbi:hypothetical protein PIROE2DRAFT_61834 [Piromyces sp. E2]|nr:hypothetical protein PIROE2DRAFT_61834 [Piromyces sp. E2]|eukprot:OUM62525.1 hypothetical protein PIROE2DRAFT_61834 [Piromyces sp. E2]
MDNIDCNGITNVCKLLDVDTTDYRSINEDFKTANITTNGKNFKTNYVNQLNAQNIENDTIKITNILSYKNSIINNLVALTRKNDSNNISKYNTTGLKVINEIFMLLAQFKFYKDLQEEKKKKNNLKLVEAYKLNVSENTINKLGSSFSVNYSDHNHNGLLRNKESGSGSMSQINSNNDIKNKNNNVEEENITLNKIIVKMKSSFFLGNINGIGTILNIIISENIITGEYYINHYIGHQYQISVLPVLHSEYNIKDNILLVPIYNELKEPYLMAWSIPNFNVEWICKLSALSNIDNQIIIPNVASDDMILEDKLKQYVKTKNPCHNLDYQDITAISFDSENFSYILALKKGFIVELKWNISDGSFKIPQKADSLNKINETNTETENSETLNSQDKDNDNNNILLNVTDINNNNESIFIENNNKDEKLSKKILTASLLIKLDPCTSDVLLDKTEEFINDDDINNTKYKKNQADIEKIQIIPLSMNISRPKLSNPKQITVGCSDGTLRKYQYSSIMNKYIESLHYEVGQENIKNNITTSYNSKLDTISFNDKEEKINMLKWKSIKDVFRSNIIGLSVCIDDFALTIGYTKDG